MPKRTDIHKILVIGSGPIVIGQAAEFDYSGTQACLALKEEGYQVILVNSNPATIMTDTHIADKVYMEPLNLEYVARIIRKERPDAMIPTLGGQTGLNLAMQLAQKGVLKECGVEILGTSFDSIDQAEDREKFKELCLRIGEPVLDSFIAHSVEEAKEEANKIGYPIVLRPAFTLGGTGGGFCDNDEELEKLAESALNLSPVGQVLVEKSIKGYKEIEFEVMRDKNDTAIGICSMENIDPVGVHTGDSYGGGPGPDPDGQRIPHAAGCRAAHHPGTGHRRRLQRPVRPGPLFLPLLRHRSQPPGVPFLGAGFQGQRLSPLPRCRPRSPSAWRWMRSSWPTCRPALSPPWTMW